MYANYRQQENPHLTSNLSIYHHIHLHILHALHTNTVLIKFYATRNTKYRLGNWLQVKFVSDREQEVSCCGISLIGKQREKLFSAELFEVGLDLFHFLHFIVNLSLILQPLIVNRGNVMAVRTCGGSGGGHHTNDVFAFGDL